jgi:hypothetical protein
LGKAEIEEGPMIKPGIDVGGMAQIESDHFMKCPECGLWFDMRDFTQVTEHAHDAEIEIGEGEGPPPREGELQ